MTAPYPDKRTIAEQLGQPDASTTPKLAGVDGIRRVRKLTKCGGCYLVSVPSVWVRAHCRPDCPYILASYRNDGTIVLRQLQPADLVV